MEKCKGQFRKLGVASSFFLILTLLCFKQLSADEQVKQGAVLYKQACYACHDAGLVNAPKLGDKVAWKNRKTLAIETLSQTVISGKGAMPPRGGTQYTDAQIKQIIAFMLSKVK